MCVYAAFLRTPPQPGGSHPMGEGGDCAFIGMESEMAGGGGPVGVIECAAWRRKRETERRERGRGLPCV